MYGAHFDSSGLVLTSPPLQDGNGRTTRLITSIPLMMHGYPPISIGLTQRSNYYDAINKASQCVVPVVIPVSLNIPRLMMGDHLLLNDSLLHVQDGNETMFSSVRRPDSTPNY